MKFSILFSIVAVCKAISGHIDKNLGHAKMGSRTMVMSNGARRNAERKAAPTTKNGKRRRRQNNGKGSGGKPAGNATTTSEPAATETPVEGDQQSGEPSDTNVPPNGEPPQQPEDAGDVVVQTENNGEQRSNSTQASDLTVGIEVSTPVLNEDTSDKARTGNSTTTPRVGAQPANPNSVTIQVQISDEPSDSPSQDSDVPMGSTPTMETNEGMGDSQTTDLPMTVMEESTSNEVPTNSAPAATETTTEQESTDLPEILDNLPTPTDPTGEGSPEVTTFDTPVDQREPEAESNDIPINEQQPEILTGSEDDTTISSQSIPADETGGILENSARKPKYTLALVVCLIFALY